MFNYFTDRFGFKPPVAEVQPKAENNPAMEALRKFIDSAKAVKDPNVLMAQLAQTNPHMKEAVDYVKDRGGDPKTVCLDLLKRNGIDPGDISKMVSG